MKKLMYLFVILLSFNAHAFKVGVVDMEKVMTTIDDGKKIKKTLTKMLEEGKESLKKQEESIIELNKTYEKQKAILSDTAKETKEREIVEKTRELQMAQMQLENTIMKKEEELKEPVLTKLQEILDKIAADRNLDLTVTRTANPFITIKNQIDISNEVILKYNKK